MIPPKNIKMTGFSNTDKYITFEKNYGNDIFAFTLSFEELAWLSMLHDSMVK